MKIHNHHQVPRCTGIRSYVFLFLSLLFVPGLGAQGYRVPFIPPASDYLIDAAIDMENGTISGKETITLRNPWNDPLAVLALDWRATSGSRLEVSCRGTVLKPENPDNVGGPNGPLVYQLPEPLKGYETLELAVSFSMSLGSLPEEGKPYLLSGWHPRLLWDGLYEPLPVHDRYKAKLALPEGYAVVLSAVYNEETGYYENEGVANFGIVLGKGLQKLEREAEGIHVSALCTEKGRKCAELCLETACDVLKFYKQFHGFFPFPFLSIIPGASEPMGGYPFASGIVVIHGQEQFEARDFLHWQWITAHEIGHQYWGEYVMNMDRPAWLWIGLGIYADRQYILSRNLGHARHEELMKRYLQGVERRNDTTPDIPPAQLRKISFDFNNIVIHGKGWSIISALESVMGKECFLMAYHAALKEYGRKWIRYRDFWRLCESACGENLDWFFEQWARSDAYLAYAVTQKECVGEGDRFRSTIAVEKLGSMSMPIPVKAVFEDGTTQMAVTGRLMTQNILTFMSAAPLDTVILDPAHNFAMLTGALPAAESDIAEMIGRLPWSGAGAEAPKLYKIAVGKNIKAADAWLKMGLTLFKGNHLEESFDSFERLIQCKPQKIYTFTAFVWLGHLKDLAGERKRALGYYEEALKYDEGERMQHGQLKMIIDRKYVEERMKTPFTWKF